ncbi:LacI family DNA-binding transcriptional regulator [Leucobacter sp. M11]|uniref:LacI family DNA-binding transcriptional regulator n=1 Tax=Leucobacter sp. M11 TaxID=2993565 RepID=UPI002D7F31E3|nr:LacI family DNA-binding transcriptional regulator [Leucobacter sp. M11]MEB4615768.1 LacI family DNA-binding transcriptional regulator [Leucobacter sp. M11]
MAVTLKKIAEQLDLSAAAVSMAINGKPGVSEETRDLVLRTAEELGYKPNRMGQSLRLARTGAIGVYFPSTVLEYSLYFAEVTRGITAGLADTDLSPVLLPSALENGDVRDFPSVDGLIIVEPHSDDLGMFELLRGDTPTVTLDPPPPSAERPWGIIESDNAGLVREAFGHLASRGSRLPALLTVETVSDWTAQVERGYLAWCAERGIEPAVIRTSVTHSNEEVRQILERALPSARQPGDAQREREARDGLFVCGDGFALRIAGVLRSMGLSVGEDVHLVSGVDSTIMQYHTPPISSVDMNPYAYGVRAAQMIHRLLKLPERPSPPSYEVIPAPIIARAT